MHEHNNDSPAVHELTSLTSLLRWRTPMASMSLHPTFPAMHRHHQTLAVPYKSPRASLSLPELQLGYFPLSAARIEEGGRSKGHWGGVGVEEKGRKRELGRTRRSLEC